MVTDKAHALSHIELGKIVLYCAQEPIVKKSEPVASTQKKGFVDVIYFLPLAQCTSQEAKQMMATFNGSNQDAYICIHPFCRKTSSGYGDQN